MNHPFSFNEGWSNRIDKWKRLRNYESQARKQLNRQKRLMDENIGKLEQIAEAINDEMQKRVADGRINPKDPNYIEAKENFDDLAATRDMFFLYEEAKNNPDLADEILKEFTKEEEE